MSDAALFSYAYLVGTAFSALIGSVVEMRAGQSAGMRPPFMASDPIIRSLGLTLCAGSYLMISELRVARGRGALSTLLVMAGVLFVSIWALATGIILVELMTQVRSFL